MAKLYFELSSDKPTRHHLAQLLQDASFLHASDVAAQSGPYPEATAFTSEEEARIAHHGRIGQTPVMLEIELPNNQALALLDKAVALHGGVVIDRKLADLSQKSEPHKDEAKTVVADTQLQASVAEKPDAKRK